MTPRELAGFLPNRMPEGLVLSPGDHVLLRLTRQSSVIREGEVLEIFEAATGERYQSVTLNRQNALDLCIKVHLDGDRSDQYPIWPFQDGIFTYEWVNDFAGRTIVEEPGSSDIPSVTDDKQVKRMGERFKRLIDN